MGRSARARGTLALAGGCARGVAGIALAVGIGACDRTAEVEVTSQPMVFSHAAHVAEDLTCLDCHNQADKSPHASTITIDGCMKCHGEAKEGEASQLEHLRELYTRGEEIPWRWVNRLPGHVYFPHEAHVRYGEMECQECHGKVEEATEAFTASQVVHLTMSACIACHEERLVDTDCAACHK